MRVSGVSAVLLLSLAAVTSAQGEAREGRPKPWLKQKMERQKVVMIDIDSIYAVSAPVSVFRTCSGSAPRRTRPARPPAPPWTRPAWRSCRGRPGTPARCSTYSTVRAVQYSTVQLFRLIAIYPYSSHQEDGARFCFCGKKGAAETTNWKFICGT